MNRQLLRPTLLLALLVCPQFSWSSTTSARHPLLAPALRHSPAAVRARSAYPPQRNSGTKRAALSQQLPVDIPPAQFLSATQIDAGGTPQFPVATGDINGDKRADAIAIVQNSTSSTGYYLSVLSEKTDGTFNAAVTTPVSFGSNHFLLVADLNGDHKDDVILVHPNSIDVLISQSDGTFAAAQPFPTQIASPIAARLWNVNHDNFLDVVIVDGASKQSAILAGSGTGSFGSPQLFAFPDALSAGILADVDADGNLDLVTNSAFFPGDGNGGFLPAVSFQSNDGHNAGATFSSSIAVGDVNADGLPDVITANGYWNTVSVFLNHGNRSLTQNGASVWVGNDPLAVSLGDLNWDGATDIVVTNGVQSDLAVLLGVGNGAFLPVSFGYAVGGSPSTPAALADFNNDGNVDALIADNQSSLVLAIGFGDGTLQAAPDANIVAAPGSSNLGGAVSIASGDFNGDGRPDIVVGQNSISPGLGLIVFLTQADGSLGADTVYAPTDALAYVAVGDINHDQKLDIVATNWETGDLEVLLGNGDGTFQAPTTISLPGYANGVVTGDFNGDGWTDVALAGTDPAVYVLLNDGTGTLTPAVTYPISATAFELAASDINNDNKLDLCVAMTYSSHVALLMGKGDGSFAAAPDFDPTVSAPYGIAIGDVNQDGKPDLIVSSLDAGNISIALGNGDGSFQTPSVYSANAKNSQITPGPAEVQLLDINADGAIDIAFANSNHGSLGVLLGAGDGSFYGPFEFPAGGQPFGLVTADLTNSGAADLVTSDSSFSGVSVFYNTSGTQSAPDYSVQSSVSTLQISAGGSGSVALSVASLNAFSGAIQFACQNLPQVLTCTFSPSVLHLTKGASGSSQLTIAATTVAAARPRTSLPLLAAAFAPLFGLFFLYQIPRAGRSLLLFALLAGILLCTGCQSVSSGGNTQPPPQAKTYTINVAALTPNGKSHTVPLTVTVQP